MNWRQGECYCCPGMEYTMEECPLPIIYLEHAWLESINPLAITNANTVFTFTTTKAITTNTPTSEVRTISRESCQHSPRTHHQFNHEPTVEISFRTRSLWCTTCCCHRHNYSLPCKTTKIQNVDQKPMEHQGRIPFEVPWTQWWQSWWWR